MSNNLNVDSLYFERQRKKLCGLHVINNFFQQEKYNQRKLDEIAYEIDISNRLINPHKSFFGLGNYDANVLVHVFINNDYEIQWFDKRNALEEIDFNMLGGILINTVTFRIFGLYESRHWTIIKNMDNESSITESTSSTINDPNNLNYVLFDSSNSKPIKISEKSKLINYLKYLQKNSKAELILIYKNPIHSNNEKENEKENNNNIK
ncbi:hypothetical protein DICPUDRAFT_89426 [Dictyostelium purpureum]|uniref:ubiquitinyl hydrolase 1 n=1 Tax=Dictyostelium purpureum TaxID=5786 RepID=F0ZVQ6_DICPU|nr:uncharacterized protein DICPUDRAFT_89426 [Dictyostelium purpureum]EGC31969.1 hypothetical protein DICPUDRAFT_89426 [Dictyostelium purpureum]|eukprot:XP_003291505.1 hypothetical protein DICPUDRAFT_89426 [Dictyostelium purpureum]